MDDLQPGTPFDSAVYFEDSRVAANPALAELKTWITTAPPDGLGKAITDAMAMQVTPVRDVATIVQVQFTDGQSHQHTVYSKPTQQ